MIIGIARPATARHNKWDCRGSIGYSNIDHVTITVTDCTIVIRYVTPAYEVVGVEWIGFREDGDGETSV